LITGKQNALSVDFVVALRGGCRNRVHTRHSLRVLSSKCRRNLNERSTANFVFNLARNAGTFAHNLRNYKITIYTNTSGSKRTGAAIRDRRLRKRFRAATPCLVRRTATFLADKTPAIPSTLPTPYSKDIAPRNLWLFSSPKHGPRRFNDNDRRLMARRIIISGPYQLVGYRKCFWQL